MEKKLYGEKESQVSQKEIRDYNNPEEDAESIAKTTKIKIAALDHIRRFAKISGLGLLVYLLGYFRYTSS